MRHEIKDCINVPVCECSLFLNDSENHLVNAKEGVTKANRQLRFAKEKQPDKAVIKNFVNSSYLQSKSRKGTKACHAERVEYSPRNYNCFF